jgi:maltokinase
VTTPTATASVVEQLAVLLPDYLARQRFFAGDEPPESVEIVDHEQFDGVLWLLARVPGDAAAYQVPVGFQPLDQMEEWLKGKGRSLIGDLDDGDRPLLAYDATIDPSLVPTLLAQALDPLPEDTSVRPLAVEQSNTSLIVGEQLVLKLYRRVYDGPNPDAELVGALDTAGFDAVPHQLGAWRRGGRDLAVARTFLRGSADGWSLAVTSLRDLYQARVAPEDAGGDFGPAASALGSLVARLHVALAEAFGTAPGDASAWAAELESGLVDLTDAATLTELDGAGAAAVAALARYEHLAGVGDPGPAIRIHGDLHLGQLLFNDDGWYVLDFEGEPRLPLDRRSLPSSPLRDVAGMLRSFHYAAEVVLVERHEPHPDPELGALALAWEDRAANAFLAAYLNEPGIDALLPADDAALHTVLGAFELGKAVYEVGYERDHRPDWLTIPWRAVQRLTS